ncbi:hypothetical protein GCM10020358_28780 [Amorphoplanes nipponensis]
MKVAWPALRREITVEGPRATEDVWDRYVRPRRWPEWSPQIRSVDYPGDLLSPGTSGVVHGPAGLPVPFQIIGVDDAGTGAHLVVDGFGGRRPADPAAHRAGHRRRDPDRADRGRLRPRRGGLSAGGPVGAAPPGAVTPAC